MRLIRIAALSVLLAGEAAICSTGCGAAMTERTRVTVFPPVGVAPLAVTLRAVIDAPTADWYCPAVTVLWPDGTRSAEESDCPPWEDVSKDLRRWYWSRRIGLGPGEWAIDVELVQGARREPHELRVEVH